MADGPEYIPTPEERQRNREQARGRSPGGTQGSNNWWRRRSMGAKVGILVVAVVIGLAALGAALGGGNDTPSPVTATEAADATSKPTPAVKTPAQIKAEARAQARAQTIARAKARVAARAKAKAAAAARVRAREAAAAHAAYVAAANRWHRGYYRQNANV